LLLRARKHFPVYCRSEEIRVANIATLNASGHRKLPYIEVKTQQFWPFVYFFGKFAKSYFRQMSLGLFGDALAISNYVTLISWGLLDS
jgi:hypothetical protein